MADHPLRPATDRRLGKPLPHQQANRTSAAPIARGPCGSPAFLRRAYAVLARLSLGYPPLRDTFRCITHPFAARRQGCPRAAARLACVKHAASVQSEPGSNSSVRSLTSNSIDVGPIPIHIGYPSADERQDLPPPLRFDPRGQKLFASCEHQNFLKCLPGFHRPRRCQRRRLRPRCPSTPAPTLIGCEFLKNRPARTDNRETPAERRDYTSKSGPVNTPTIDRLADRSAGQTTGPGGAVVGSQGAGPAAVWAFRRAACPVPLPGRKSNTSPVVSKKYSYRISYRTNSVLHSTP